jgi:murein L,D-transpeptidase YcbB/YkuD
VAVRTFLTGMGGFVRLKRSVAVLSSTLMALAGVISVAASAQAAPAAPAATSKCNNRASMTGYLGGGVYGLSEVPSYGTSTSCTLSLNANTGTDPGTSPVYWLQYNLNKCYGRSLTIDGVYGAKTVAAVKYAQSTVPGLTQDGVYGPNTRSAITWDTEHTGAHGAVTRACLAFSQLK